MQSGSASVTVNSAHDISSDLPIWIASGSGPTKVAVSGGIISGLQAITTGTSGTQSVMMTGGTLLSTTNGAINTFSAGNGSTTINQSGGTIGTSAAPVNAGIVAESSGGPVDITAGTIIGDKGIGVNRTNTGTPGAVNITTNGPITTVPQGGHAAGTAIDVSSPTGPTSVTNNSAILSGYNGTAYGVIGIVEVDSAGGTIAIINNASGSITSNVSNAETLPVLITSGGASTLVNAGSLTGTIGLADAPNRFNNSGTWNSSGVNSFGSSASSFVNSGTLNTGSQGPASFTTTGTLSFVNNGSFNLLGPTTIGAVATIGAGQTLTIASGSALTGSGTIAGNMVVANGATYSPGSSTPGTFMTQTGSLTLLTGSAYGVVLNNNMSTFAKVSGTVTVAGTVNATFLPDSYAQKSFTILTSNGLTGTFSGLSTSNLPANFTPFLTYDSNNAYLTLKAALTPPASTTTAQTTAGTSTNPTAQSGTTAPATNGATTGGNPGGGAARSDQPAKCRQCP